MGRAPMLKCKNCDKKKDKLIAGLCRSCWRKKHQKVGVCVGCGKQKATHAKGRCNWCYIKLRRGVKSEFQTPVTLPVQPQEEIVDEPVLEAQPPKAEPKPEPTPSLPVETHTTEDITALSMDMSIADFIGAISRYYYLQTLSILYYMLGIGFIFVTAWLCIALTSWFLIASTLCVFAVWKGISARREAFEIACDLGMAQEAPAKAFGKLFTAKPKAASKEDW